MRVLFLLRFFQINMNGGNKLSNEMKKKGTPSFHTIDGATLMSTPLQPLRFVVDSLISQGLHVHAGSPKIGKSWLALWLSVMVAKGEPVWDMPTRQGTTLYPCLEDSRLRIQNRLFEIIEDAPPSVHFCTEGFIIGGGLEERIENFVAEYPDTTLIIIDTLQMVRGTGYDNTYANDYRDLSVLKKLADKHGVAILLIHHLRKEGADDVFNRISGTTGVQGAVDSSFTLIEDKRGSGKAKLSCIGRDIE
jgi:RecA-family ATPase